MKHNLILASSSPRRKKMLEDLEMEFKCLPANINETVIKNEMPLDYVQRIAKEKAEAVAKKVKSKKQKKYIILAADTIVVYKNRTLGKPKSKKEALKTLMLLSGKSHTVFTAFYVIIQTNEKQIILHDYDTTQVTIAKKDLNFWKWYVQTNEPMDKAGSYGAQGLGMTFIESINGSFSNVIGLPITKISDVFIKKIGKDLCELC